VCSIERPRTLVRSVFEEAEFYVLDNFERRFPWRRAMSLSSKKAARICALMMRHRIAMSALPKPGRGIARARSRACRREGSARLQTEILV